MQSSPPLVLTGEQAHILELAKTGRSLVVKAFAGTGKTSTLAEVAKHLPGTGLYLAYNKAIQVDACAKFPTQVVCKTAHALAYGAYAKRIQGRVQTLDPLLFMQQVKVNAQGRYKAIELAYLAIKMLRLFCYSGYDTPGTHFVTHSAFAMVGDDEQSRHSVLGYVAELANRYWALTNAKNTRVPIEHDFYLKHYQLSQPDLAARFQYILFDEGQDANPALLSLLGVQRCQMIYVGDEHQQIYGWRGAINALNQVETQPAFLTQSFRFGSHFALLANIILSAKGEAHPLRGLEGIDSKCLDRRPDTHTVLTRTNAGLIEQLIECLHCPVHVVGGVNELIWLAKSGYALYQGQQEAITHHQIKSFSSWSKLKEFNEAFSDPELSLLVKLIERYKKRFPEVIKAIECAPYVSEPEAKVILSTIHKAKGREWPVVSVQDDFALFASEKPLNVLLKTDTEEFNLMYVAITRARYSLYLEQGFLHFLERLKTWQAAQTHEDTRKNRATHHNPQHSETQVEN